MNRAAWLVVLGLATLLVGCKRAATTASSGPPPGMFGPSAPELAIDPSEPFAAGKQVFAANGCARCHLINGARLGGGGPAMGGPPMAGGPPGVGPTDGPPAGGPMPGGPMMPGGMRGRTVGPDLGTVGKDPEHHVGWLMEHIRNPKAHKPESRMPAFDGRIQPDDLKKLAEYLGSLK